MRLLVQLLIELAGSHSTKAAHNTDLVELRPAAHSGMQMMGGRFRSIMPSDLFKPGAMARESLRAPGRDYASTVNREELQRLMRR